MPMFKATRLERRIAFAPFLAAMLILGGLWGRARADDAEKWKESSRLYDTYCAQCHGMGRNGKGINARSMPVQPRDHADAKGMGAIPDAEIIKAITDGGLSVNKSVLMPAWGKVLSRQQILDLAAYLRQVCKCGTASAR
jgi:cytochrome c oxidase cbb3-type subunit 3